MRNYETNGVIKNGVLSIRNRKLFDKAVLSFGDCEIELKISKKSRNRTSPQNRYYWGVIVFYWQQILEQDDATVFFAVTERTVQDRGAELLGILAVPDVLEPLFEDVAHLHGRVNPATIADPAAGADFKRVEGCRTEELIHEGASPSE